MVTLELSKLSNAALHSKLLDLAAESRCNEAFLLRFLTEVEDRKLYLDQAYPSLFEYCRLELKVSESAAWRLIASARAAKQYPQIYELLAAGVIHSTAVAMIASSLKDEGTAAERLALACGKTKRELEVMIAGWSAKPAAKVRDSIRALAGQTPEASQAAGFNFEQPKQAESGDGARPKQKEEPAAHSVGAEQRRMVIKFEATGDLVDLIDRAKEVLAHLEAGRSLATLFGEALEALLDKRDPVRVAARAKARQRKKEKKATSAGKARSEGQESGANVGASAPSAEAPSAEASAAEAPAASEMHPKAEAQRSLAADPSALTPPPVKPATTITRYIPAAIRAEVTAQSGGQCEYSFEGRRCSARASLEVDHVMPFALGGKSELGNLRHLCAAHNHQRAVQTFGARDQQRSYV